MHTVLVVILPVFIVALVVTVARITTVAVTITVTVAVLFAFSIARRPLFTVLGMVSLLAVRTIVVVLFATALTALLTRGTVFLIGR